MTASEALIRVPAVTASRASVTGGGGGATTTGAATAGAYATVALDSVGVAAGAEMYRTGCGTSAAGGAMPTFSIPGAGAGAAGAAPGSAGAPASIPASAGAGSRRATAGSGSGRHERRDGGGLRRDRDGLGGDDDRLGRGREHLVEDLGDLRLAHHGAHGGLRLRRGGGRRPARRPAPGSARRAG